MKLLTEKWRDFMSTHEPQEQGEAPQIADCLEFEWSDSGLAMEVYIGGELAFEVMKDYPQDIDKLIGFLNDLKGKMSGGV